MLLAPVSMMLNTSKHYPVEQRECALIVPTSMLAGWSAKCMSGQTRPSRTCTVGVWRRWAIAWASFPTSVILAGSSPATTGFNLNLLRPMSVAVRVAVADITSLRKRSGVARIDTTNKGNAACAAQGTVTIVGPEGGAS